MLQLPPFDFRVPEALTLEERIHRSIRNVTGSVPEVNEPVRAVRLEQRLGVPFPEEYFAFVAMYRELEWQGGGFSIWGSGPSGNTPFLRDDLAQNPLLVVGDYFRFADGDQLILDHHTPEGSMYLYLHEDDSLSLFAPTFSLGLWRFAFESF